MKVAMKVKVGLCAACLCLAFGCRTVPMTNRTQLMLSPESSEQEEGLTAYTKYKDKYKVSTNATMNATLQRCGEAIRKVADRDDFKWEFTLLESDEENAFCLPGGKVAFYSGIVKKMQNEAEMAFVMSHEIAHAIARHGGERVSWGMLQSLGGLLVSVGFNNETISDIYGAGSNLGVMLPFSRKNEAEADYIGLMLMAKAGYDPHAAATFWKRFSAGQQEADVIDGLLSTHPCDADRIKAMEDNLAAALEEYEKAPVKHGLGQSF